MATSALPSRPLRFDDFEVDLCSGELWKSGKRVRLQDQPFQVLCALLQRQGEIVTREELKQTLWPADTFVDFDDGLNTAVRKIRDVLGDSAEKPRYIETIPRRGYRFVGQLADVRPVVLPPPAEESKAGPERENTRLRRSAHADLQTQKALSSVPALYRLKLLESENGDVVRAWSIDLHSQELTAWVFLSRSQKSPALGPIECRP